MKTFLISGVSAFVLAGAAMAVPFEDADTDGDGRISFEELQAVDPMVTEAEFTLYDVNLDGHLDEDEYAAWQIATQRDAEPAPLDEPLADEFDMPEEPVDETEPFQPDPSLEKSLLKSDEHDEDEKDKDEERDGYGDGYGSDDDEGLFALLADEPPADDWSDEHGDEEDSEDDESDEDAGDDEEDGDEERPW